MRVVQFGDEGKVTRDLPVIFDQKTFLLQLPEFYILKCKLLDRKARETLQADDEVVTIKTAIQFECQLRKRKKKSCTSRLLKDTDGRKSFSILSMARTISSNTFLWRSALTTLTCKATTMCLYIKTSYQKAVRGENPSTLMKQL